MSNPNAGGELRRTGGRSPIVVWLVWVIWTAYLIPAVVILIQAHPAPLRLATALACTALFVALYLWATWQNARDLFAHTAGVERIPPAKWLILLALMALSFTLALLGGGGGGWWWSPFIFTAAYAAGSFPPVRVAQVIGVLVLLAVLAGWLTGLSWVDVGQSVVQIVVVGAVVVSLVRSVLAGQELRAAREEIARLAVITERLRIARDLHDLLGHNLSLIALKSELAGRLVGPSPEKAAAEIHDIENVARTTLQEVREVVGRYRRATLANEVSGAEEILSAAGIVYRYEGADHVMDGLPPASEAVLSWAVREGVTNVIRHSHAHTCTIRVTRDRSTAGVEIRDDGTGEGARALSAGAVAASKANGGSGLPGLSERVAALGGQLEAAPYANGGFRLAVSVPLVQGGEPQ
jgi:two-component system sensor histidine kinase DesK